MCVSFSSVFPLYIELLALFSASVLIACSILYFFSSRSFLSLPVGLFSYLRDLSERNKVKVADHNIIFAFSTKVIPPFTKHRETTTFRLMYFTHIYLHRKTRCFTLKSAKTRCSSSLLQSSGFESGNLMCFMKTSTLTLV